MDSVAREKGRFRTFLLVALKRFLANEWDRARAQKRGGGQVNLTLDTSDGETRYQIEPSAALDASRIYDRRWALTLLEQTMARLRAEFTAAGKSREFDHLKVFLTAEKAAIDYPALAVALGQSEGALRVAIHRLRKRFRELFREGIAHTVTTPAEIEEEVRYLMAALGGMISRGLPLNGRFKKMPDYFGNNLRRFLIYSVMEEMPNTPEMSALAALPVTPDAPRRGCVRAAS